MFDWGRIWLIAKREVRTRFKQRSYRWTLILQVVIVAIASLAPVGIAWFSGDDASGASVVVVDEADAGIAQRIEPHLEGDGQILQSISVHTDAATADEAREMVDEGDRDYALIVTSGEEGSLAYELVTDDGNASTIEAQLVMGGVMAASVEVEAEERGLSSEEARQLMSMPEVRIETVSGDQSESSSESLVGFQNAAWGVAYFGIILIYMAIILYGTWVATGVAEEKGSRIMEIMVNAATPRDLLFGKVLGIMLAGLAQLVPMLIVGGVMLSLQPRIAEALDVELTGGMSIDFAEVSVTAVTTFLVYFLFGFLLYGALYAGVGSMVSRQEEVNQAISPMMTVIVVAFFGSVIAINMPESMLAKVLMIVPFTSPFVALPRVLLGDPAAGEIALSIGLLVIAAIGALWVAGRLYRVGVLMYGQRPGWKSLVKLGRMQGVSR